MEMQQFLCPSVDQLVRGDATIVLKVFQLLCINKHYLQHDSLRQASFCQWGNQLSDHITLIVEINYSCNYIQVFIYLFFKYCTILNMYVHNLCRS